MKMPGDGTKLRKLLGLPGGAVAEFGGQEFGHARRGCQGCFHI